MKILVISDIHLRAYHRFNKFPDQRLLSFLELAKDVVKIGKKEGINVLIITGDIIDKSTLSPKEIHILFNMFTILADHFTIYSIVGNHDMKLKKGEFEREDSIVTLLEEIEGIKFLHQEVLNLGGRTLAFENWVPEFKLDWLKDPVDLYFSHATIDYDQAGFYGMDTSVFEGKFKLGFFGDIHVRRELDNYISVGNTKQESLSDRYQGGGVIIDLDTLEWERFDIDPEHKKYLYLLPTKESDEEGWVDLEGEDMTYRIYKPEKVAGKTIQFTLPKTTDIESTLESIMKELNLLDLHKDIKSQTDYQPIDFNFKLNKLIVKNFRSVKDYTLDFKDDYVITGPNGSGKSTLITALFYALIGKKTLKQDITFGEKSCTLNLNLTYQKQDFVILRGTENGDYGLSINGEVQKYNNKLEFEKDVYLHLPFLHYHEAFFFNYWDTELLGSMKLDKRFDLIAKFFRLDALSDYNDVGTVELKKAKKTVKDLRDKHSTDLILAESKQGDYDTLSKELKGKAKLEDLELLRENYVKKKSLSKDLSSCQLELNSSKSSLDELKSLLTNSESTLNTDKSELKGSKTESVIDIEVENYTKRTGLQPRFDKGNTLLTDLRNKISTSSKEIENNKYTLTLIDPGEEKELDPKLQIELDSIETSILSKSNDISRVKTTSELELDTINSQLITLSKKLEEVNKPANCNSCGKPISNEENIKILNTKINETKKSLEETQAKLDKILKEETDFLTKEKPRLDKKKTELSETISSIKSHNAEVEKSAKSVQSIQAKILEIETSIETDRLTETKYVKALTDLEEELRSLPFISEMDNTNNLILKSKYSKLKRSQEVYDKAKSDYDKAHDEFKASSKTLSNKISELETELKLYESIDEDDNLNAALLIAKYNQFNEVSQKMKQLKKDIAKSDKQIEAADKLFNNLDTYCQLTSRSGEVLKKTLEDLTKTFSNSLFRFTTDKAQASGKLVTDMSVEYLVGKNWVSYPALSSGQKTLCDLYFISKVVTGVGIVSFDETLRFLDDENTKLASELISDIKKQNLLISSHSPNLYIEGVSVLSCKLNSKSVTEISLY